MQDKLTHLTSDLPYNLISKSQFKTETSLGFALPSSMEWSLLKSELSCSLWCWFECWLLLLSPPGGHRLAGSPAHRDPDAVWGRDQHRHPHLLLLREHRRWLWADGNFLVRCPTPQGIPRNISRKPRSNTAQIFSDFVEPQNSVKSSHHRLKFNPEVWKISRWHMTWLEIVTMDLPGLQFRPNTVMWLLNKITFRSFVSKIHPH